MSDDFHQRLHHVVPGALSADTAQTTGMRRVEAISGKTVGSVALWMRQTQVSPATSSDNHHHGESETAIYVVSGHPVFVFFDEAAGVEKRLETGPPAARMSGLPVINGQVSRDQQLPVPGAVLGCILPPRSTCASTTFSLFNHRVMLRLGTRFGASIGGTNLLPRPG